MRQTRDSSSIIGVADSGPFCGIDLGADHVAEHQSGIGGLYKHFGITLDNTVEGFKATKVPASLNFRKKGDLATLVVGDSISTKLILENKCGDLYLPENREITASWDNDSFGIVVKGMENVAHLEELFNAIRGCDILFSFEKRQPFQNRHLQIGIFSKVKHTIPEPVNAA